jgi:hypothetical protein
MKLGADSKVVPFVNIEEPDAKPLAVEKDQKPRVGTWDSSEYGFEGIAVDSSDPHLPSNARNHRDGIDGICQAVEWIHHLRSTGQSNAAREAVYQKSLQAEIEYWRLFTTPDDIFTAEYIKKATEEIWTWPIKRGRLWPEATIRLAILELGLEV